MNTAEFLSELHGLDIRLAVDGQGLRVNAPQGTLTASLREQISRRKAEILQFLQNASAVSRYAPPPIRPLPREQPMPLSFAQERLWFLEQLEPGSSVYNVCRASRLVGQLNLSALEASLNEIVRRHEVLRSAIRVVEARPVQIVQSVFQLKVSVTHLQHLADRECEQEISRRIQQAADTAFDFSSGRFLRSALLCLRNDEHILILTTHHIVSDAWSLAILMRELWSVYESYTAGNPFPLEDLKLQYADFAVWQRAWLQKDILESQVSYWKEQLKDLAHLTLPTDRPRPARQSFEAARIPITLPETLTTAIRELSNHTGVTPFMTLLAAFQILLYRYCGQEEIIVGSPIANRPCTELESLIGFFVNTLVLRSDLSGNPAFEEVLARVREVCLGAYAHQDLPFEKLVQELQPERNPSRNPLFQILFVMQNATRPFSGIPGLSIEPVERETTRSQFDLSLFLRERDGKYLGYFEYSTDLFDRETIERIGTNYRTLLEAAIANPNHPIATLPILTAAERYKILVEWNDTAADYPKDECIHQLFEEQVERTPDASAVGFEHQQITYRELNRRANQLAHYLISLGIGPEKLVGICVERSIEMVVGLLGILKAGGAYVPLDPAYPPERLEFMLEDAKVSVLLTTEDIIEDGRWIIEDGDPQSLRPGSGQASILDPRLPVVCLDADFRLIKQQKNDNPKQAVTSENLAYVIYTSGSTGQPKGVQITHRSVINLLYTTQVIFSFNANDVWTGFHSYAFDFSVWEIWGCMTNGGRLVVVPSNVSQSPVEFWKLLLREGVTVLNQTPTALSQLMLAKLELDVSRDSSLRLVISGGEPLPRELASALREWRLPAWNFYGPTEATVWATIHQLDRSDLRDVSIPIGRPIPNSQIYILDAHFQPVPIGVPGELYIGGDGLSRGYLNRPALDADRFVPHPFTHEPAARLYRSGDTARYLSNGNVEFVCRRDNQVKIRGYRIELGEIEAVLNRHQAVRQSVAVVEHEDKDPQSERDKRTLVNPNSGSRLVVYAVPNRQYAVSVDELRRYLKKKLPEYMVPSRCVLLDRLPQNRNGKIDRQALSYAHGKTVLVERLKEPRTQPEELIAQIWTELLKLESVGVHDNFFDLGGHSLVAMQIVSRLCETFRCEIPLRVLFEAPTIADLARQIAKLILESDAPELPSILQLPHSGLVPLSLNQEHLWILDQMIPGTHFFNVPLIYRLSGSLDIEALRRSVREIVRRHEILRTVFPEFEGNPVQIVQSVPDCRVPMLDFRSSSLIALEQRVTEFILEERRTPFSLATGPLLRSKLLRLTDSEYFLLVTMHHIICDQWSIRIFCRELATLYECYSQARRSSLPDPPIQFADFAVWERQSVDSDFMKAQLAYWKNQLSGTSSTLKFRRMSEETNGINFRTSRIVFELKDDLASGIKALAQTHNCTPFMVLLAVFSAVLFTFTGESDIRIGTLVANRRRESTELTVGHFVNTVILRIRIRPGMSVSELLRQVREVTTAAYTHQELPFQHLARALEQHYERRALLFQVLVIYQSPTFESMQIPGLEFAPVSFKQLGADRDVTITAADIVLDVRESTTRLIASLVYKTNAIARDDADRMIERFTDMLEFAISSPAGSFSKFTPVA